MPSKKTQHRQTQENYHIKNSGPNYSPLTVWSIFSGGKWLDGFKHTTDSSPKPLFSHRPCKTKNPTAF